jgi:hypothetical protein
MRTARNALTRLGIYTTRVFVVQRKWLGGRRGFDGGFVDTAVYQGKVVQEGGGQGTENPQVGLEILPRPRVRLISSREIYNSGGIYHEGDCRVMFIQPYWVGRDGRQQGYTLEDIAPDPDDQSPTETFYRLVAASSGGVTGEYFRYGSVLEKWGHYELTLKPRLTTPVKGPVNPPP